MSKPRVIAIILNFNLVEYTIGCIKSLTKVEYPCLEILVIDNGSTDDSIPRLESTFPWLKIHSTGENLGYTGGINVGFRKAMESSPEYILVLNPDTEVDPYFLGHLVQAIEGSRQVAAVGATIYMHHDKERVWYAGGRIVWWRGLAVHDRKGEFVDPSTLGDPKQVTFITGCLVLFRADLLNSLGMEDERFFMYLDDIEFSARILAKGYSLLYVPRAVIYHKVLGEKESRLKLYYSVRNRLLLINTAVQGLNRFIAIIYFTIVILLKIGGWLITKRGFARVATYGLIDYFRGDLGKGRGVQDFTSREIL